MATYSKSMHMHAYMCTSPAPQHPPRQSIGAAIFGAAYLSSKWPWCVVSGAWLEVHG